MSVEEFVSRIREIDGVTFEESGDIAVDSLAALEIMSLLHRIAPGEMEQVAADIDIYEFDVFLKELRRVGALR